MKKSIRELIALFIAAVLVSVPSLQATYNPYVTTGFNDIHVQNIKLDDKDIVDNNGTARITVGSTVTVTGVLNSTGKVVLGTLATGISTTSVNAGGGYVTIPVKLGGTTAAVKGSALVANGNDGTNITVILCPATIDQTNVIGIAEKPIAVGSIGYAIVSGFALALTTGTVNIGAIVVSTGTNAGYLSTNANSVYGANVGIAMSSGTAAGGLTLIKLSK